MHNVLMRIILKRIEMPRWPVDEKPKRGRPVNPDKSTRTVKSNPEKQPQTTEKAFDFQPLEEKLNKRAQLEVDLRAAAAREMGKLNQEIEVLRDRHAEHSEYIHQLGVKIDAVEAKMTTKSWVKELLSRLGLK